jgi:hypothetical protein
MTTLDKETEAWLAIRKEAAKAIDPATAELTWAYGPVGNPCGIYPPDESDCIGREYFARAPGSDVWVSFHDLDTSVRDELWKRAVAEGHVLQIVVRPGEPPQLRGLPPELEELLAGRTPNPTRDAPR